MCTKKDNSKIYPTNRVIFMIWAVRKLLTFTKIKPFQPWATGVGLMTASLPCLRVRSGGMNGVGVEGDLKLILRVILWNLPLKVLRAACFQSKTTKMP